MRIRLGYCIELDISKPMAVVAVLNVHPSRLKDLLEPDEVQILPEVEADAYLDVFGNRCLRFLAPQGTLRLSNSTLIEDSGDPDPIPRDAPQLPIEGLPAAVLPFLLASRYCEVDQLSGLAWQLFGNTPDGWPRVQAILDWVHSEVTFGYGFARSTKTAMDVSVEKKGVCRDFQHLAIALCRAMHIPARYATGYLGDIRIPPVPWPMDFSAWFEVYLGGRWWACDARHNQPRIGRVLMAVGRDAADVAMTTTFGLSSLRSFEVTSYEVEDHEASCNSLVELGSTESGDLAQSIPT
ncbi:MAG TPA: transglutaminase family protein [Bryobacteraceae bacterium]|jgi:transglutaminase-like putative cysteine protease|nr:transglutaminase family protein [Bryobacteraceae bacterium]